MLSNHPSVLGSGGGTAYNIIGGTGLFADGTAAAPSISFAADTDTGFYRVAANIIGVANNGSISMAFVAGGKIQGAGLDNELALAGNGSVSLRAGGTAQNITLTPSTTGVVDLTRASTSEYSVLRANRYDIGSGGSLVAITGLRNAFYIYDGTAGATRYLLTSGGNHLLGTTTDSANGILQLATHTTSAGGIGFGADTSLYTETAGRIILAKNTAGDSTLRWAANGVVYGYVGQSGGNTYLGSLTANSVILQTNNTTALTLDASQVATFASSLGVASGATIKWLARSSFYSPSDGVITMYNNATSDFTRLQFGGTTASFPALQRSGSTLQAVVGDASAYCNFVALTGNFTSVTARSVAGTVAAGEVAYGGTTATTVGAAGGASALPATPTGYIIVNVAGANMKVPYYAN
jgi:hypothetical protein